MNPPLSAPAHLHARRCVRHATREAAARCPSCGEFFCRECVVEHEGKLLCSDCLAPVMGRGRRRSARFVALRRSAAVAAGAAVLWLLFYGAGAFLLKIPTDMHDGTIWKRTGGRVSP